MNRPSRREWVSGREQNRPSELRGVSSQEFDGGNFVMTAFMIEFEEIDGSIDAYAPGSRSWDEWVAERLQPVVHLSVWADDALFGYASPTKVGGVVIHPAEIVLGLRSWDDAYEGVDRFGKNEAESPWVLFDLEKVVRMMLHQSGMALEILASPITAPDEMLEAAAIDARRIVESAVTTDVLHYYADFVRSGRRRLARTGSEFDALELLDAVRAGLTGLELAGGYFGVQLDSLVERRGDAELADVVDVLRGDEEMSSSAVEVLDVRFGRWIDALESPEETPLPESPRDYAWLHDHVISRRIEISEKYS